MNKADLIEYYKRLVQALEEPGEFSPIKFDIYRVPDEFEEFIAHTESRGWSWGACVSDTCRHNSHDPYGEYPSVFVRARVVDEVSGLYELPNGQVFWYVNEPHGHYRPTRYLTFQKPAD
jgi:hypothetical protein